MNTEKVLCIPRAALQAVFDLSLPHWPLEVATLNALPFGYVERQLAENDFTRKQLIPYALVFDALGQLFTYQRHGSEARLVGKLSAGIGGHVNEQDRGETLAARLLAALLREMREEIGLVPKPDQIRLLGMINEDTSAVGRCHIGVVFRFSLDESLPASFAGEIAKPVWQMPSQLELAHFELWSALAIGLSGMED